MRREYLGFCLFNFLIYLTFGAIAPYINVYFESLGLTGSQLGTLSSLTSLAGMVGAPVFGYLADQFLGTKRAFMVVMLLAAGTLILFYYQRLFTYVLLAYMAYGFFNSAKTPLSDGLLSVYCNRSGHDFSRVRMLGSFGYLFGSFALPALLGLCGYDAPYIRLAVVVSLASAALLYFLPEIKVDKKEEKVNVFLAAKELLRDKRYLFMVFQYCLAGALVEAFNLYVGNHFIYTLNLDSSVIGLYTVAMVVPEVFCLFFGQRILQKVGFKPYFILSSFSQVVRLSIYSFTHSGTLFLAGSLMHGLTMVALTIGYVRYMSKIVDKRIFSTALSLSYSASMIACAAYSKVFGMLYQHFGSFAIFYVALAMSILSFVLYLGTKVFDGLEF